MAIIPAEEKVFMVSNSTNTTYSGSAALKAMQQWYTMQDVIDTVGGGGTPTLQQVTDEGNTTDQTIIVSVEGAGVNGVMGQSEDGFGVYGVSQASYGVFGQSNSSVGVVGTSVEGYGGYFSSSAGSGLIANSNSETGIGGNSNEGPGGFFTSTAGYGVGGSSTENVGGYFISAQSYALVANGTAAKPGGGSWSVYSDSRLKENVVPYTKGLSDILLINPVTYEYNGLAGTTKGKKYTGIIAQEIKEVFPDTVNTYKAKLNEEDEEKTELYDFNASDLTFALINAIKELKAEIDLLKSK